MRVETRWRPLGIVVVEELAQSFFGVVCVIDFGWAGAVGVGESAGVGDFGLEQSLGDEGVVGAAVEEQAVGVGAPAGGPGWVVVDLAVIAGFGAARSGAAAVAGATVQTRYWCLTTRNAWVALNA
ncbi:hypothetical protein A5651_08145 [Mycobacterium sp. 1274761.0]|nr:hypothetical protein A5651_08145 [Mycobacterium sp. 1274761.0]